MTTLTLDRRAYLHWIRNVDRGIARRSEIIQQLDREEWCSTSEIAQRVRVTSATILYHLHNMERENVVERDPESLQWRLAPIQQSSLEEFLRPKRKSKSK